MWEYYIRFVSFNKIVMLSIRVHASAKVTSIAEKKIIKCIIFSK